MLVTGSEPLAGAWHVFRRISACSPSSPACSCWLRPRTTRAGSPRAPVWPSAAHEARPIRLFAGVCIVSFAGSVLFSLDAAAVALTPVVLIAARRARATAEPLLFACIAVANTASMALPISNPDERDRGRPGRPRLRRVRPHDAAGRDRRVGRGVARARSPLPARARGNARGAGEHPGIANRTIAITSAVASLARARRLCAVPAAIWASSP